MNRAEMITKIMDNLDKLSDRFLRSVMIFTSKLAE